MSLARVAGECTEKFVHEKLAETRGAERSGMEVCMIIASSPRSAHGMRFLQPDARMPPSTTSVDPVTYEAAASSPR